jgi:hypothetical protein
MKGTRVDDHLCIEVRSKPGESKAEFHKRLIEFWSRLLRSRPDDYKRVYAESADANGGISTFSRKYLVHSEIAVLLEAELTRAGLDHEPIDRDDLYSKYEAAPPEWFQIPH